LRELGRLVVVVEDPAAVLIHDHNLVARGAEPIGSFKDAGTDTQDRVEQRDVSHVRQSSLQH